MPCKRLPLIMHTIDQIFNILNVFLGVDWTDEAVRGG
jgi:hypothetical protein